MAMAICKKNSRYVSFYVYHEERTQFDLSVTQFDCIPDVHRNTLASDVKNSHVLNCKSLVKRLAST